MYEVHDIHEKEWADIRALTVDFYRFFQTKLYLPRKLPSES